MQRRGASMVTPLQQVVYFSLTYNEHEDEALCFLSIRRPEVGPFFPFVLAFSFFVS
jgi:hypothetical protein